jgi:hypothetical protein
MLLCRYSLSAEHYIACYNIRQHSEGPPTLRRWSALLGHILGNGRLSEFKPEFEQFAMNAGLSPQRVLSAHLPD